MLDILHNLLQLTMLYSDSIQYSWCNEGVLLMNYRKVLYEVSTTESTQFMFNKYNKLSDVKFFFRHIQCNVSENVEA